MNPIETNLPKKVKAGQVYENTKGQIIIITAGHPKNLPGTWTPAHGQTYNSIEITKQKKGRKIKERIMHRRRYCKYIGMFQEVFKKPLEFCRIESKADRISQKVDQKIKEQIIEKDKRKNMYTNLREEVREGKYIPEATEEGFWIEREYLNGLIGNLWDKSPPRMNRQQVADYYTDGIQGSCASLIIEKNTPAENIRNIGKVLSQGNSHPDGQIENMQKNSSPHNEDQALRSLEIRKDYTARLEQENADLKEKLAKSLTRNIIHPTCDHKRTKKSLYQRRKDRYHS